MNFGGADHQQKDYLLNLALFQKAVVFDMLLVELNIATIRIS